MKNRLCCSRRVKVSDVDEKMTSWGEHYGLYIDKDGRYYVDVDDGKMDLIRLPGDNGGEYGKPFIDEEKAKQLFDEYIEELNAECGDNEEEE